MTQGINRVLLVGNLTRDPELRHTAGGTAVCDLSLANNSREKRGEEWQDRVDFFDITVWGNQAESAAQYLSKGSAVGIDGRLRQERWETDGGEKRSKVKVVADVVQFLDQKGGERGPSGVRDEEYLDGRAGRDQFVPSGASQVDDPGASSDDDIPF